MRELVANLELSKRVAMPGGMRRLVLLRHGQSEWNIKDLFTGWTDVGLTAAGVAETVAAARTLRDAGYTFDVAYTSVLSRAVKTLDIVLEELNSLWLPVHKHWRLNERHYGALQGRNKAETAREHGDDQVRAWRRSWDVPPPAVEPDDPRSALDDRRYAGLERSVLPRGESLKDTAHRVIPYWSDVIAPELRRGSTVLVAAHGNSLRALVKHLDDVPEDAIPGFEIPTGCPLVYELGADLTPRQRFFLHEGGRREAVTFPPA